MAAADPETALAALAAQIGGMAFAAAINGHTGWAMPVGRRLVMWRNVPPQQQPAAFLVRGRRAETDEWTHLGAVRRRVRAFLVAYFRTDDPTVVGDTYANTIVAALKAALAPDDELRGQFTLGGLVYWCRVEGDIDAENGDTDNQGKLMVPIVMELP